MLRTFCTLICTALTFLTRLPLVARFADPSPQALARSASLWPLIGAGIGFALAQLILLFAMVWSAWIAVWLALAVSLLLTGAFHEDGLADSFDGLWGGFNPARRLEIMRDSRIGSYGALALVVLLGLKAATLHQLSAAPTLLIAALVCAHTLARASVLPLARCLPYARDSANNKPVAEGISWRVSCAGLILALSCVGLTLSLLLPPRDAIALGALMLGCVALVLWLWGLLLKHKIAGITGDALGAANQLCEVAVLLCAAATMPIHLSNAHA